MLGNSVKMYHDSVNKEIEKFLIESKNPNSRGWESVFDKFVIDFVQNGGKRLRPILGVMAYRAMGGKDVQSMIELSRSFEFLHNAELIQDDIMDESDVRRGRPSFHKTFEEWMSKKGHYKNMVRDANSMGIIAGDYLIFMAFKNIIGTNFTDKAKMEFVKILCNCAEKTVRGQIVDIEFSKKIANEKEYLDMINLKTAMFFEDVVKLAEVAAGANKKLERNLMEYAKNIGYAFQIRDDIMGLFGDEKVMGKSNKSDLEEGKNTILMIKAREFGGAGVRKTIEKILGKKNITSSELKMIRNVVRESGSFNYAKSLIDGYSQRSFNLINEVKNDLYSDTYTFFNELSKFNMSRTI